MKPNRAPKFFHLCIPVLVASLLMSVWLFCLPGAANAQKNLSDLEAHAARLSTSDAHIFASARAKESLTATTPAYKRPQASAGILISKSAPAQVTPGSLYTYTITAENPFTYTLTGVTIGDLLPPGTNFVSVLDGGAYTTDPFSILSWSVGDLGPSASVNVRYVVSAPNFSFTVVNNVYGVWANNYNSYTLGAPVNTVVGSGGQPQGEISITKSAPAQVLPGSTFTYTLTVENPMTQTLTGVTIGDLLPLDTSFVSVLDGGSYTTDPFPILSWSLGTLDPAESVDLRFVVTAPITPTILVNHIYEVGANNVGIYTLGAPVYTVVGDRILIRQIQGSGDSSPFVSGQVFGVQGIVTNLHYSNTASTKADGFFMQDPNPDGDTLTSEGIFVYAPSYAGSLQAGQAITVAGTVDEYFDLTELTNVTSAITGTANAIITPTLVSLPAPVGTSLEPYEGMLVTIHDLTVSQNYFQGRYGQLTLSSQGRMYNPNNGNGLGDTFDLDLRRMLILDDNTSGQNPDPIPYVGQDNTSRAGDTIATLTGTLDYGQINSTFPYNRHYRLQPTQPVTISRANERAVAPEVVGGNLKVASFNVLNYFTTLDTGPAICGPNSDQDCRGANTPAEFVRQRTKIISAMLTIDADVYGLMEIENNPTDAAVIDLVNGLNAIAGAGTYNSIATGPVGADVIKVALIYNQNRVTPAGSYRIDNDPIFDRPPVAQTFRLNANGGVFTPVVNHFKSKSGCPVPPDPNEDQGDGQGCWNLKRVQQAQALLTFIDSLKNTSSDPDVLVIGDLNSYGVEDPILSLTGGGLIDEAALHVPAVERYSYVFDGLAGYLDHALATTNLDAQIEGVTYWHINADEPPFLDYNMEFNPPGYYQPDAYRSSDHDPVIVGITLGSSSVSIQKEVSPTENVDLGGSVSYTVTLTNSGDQPVISILFTDTLPAALDFGGWVQQSGAGVANDEITWSGDLPGGSSLTLVFTATVRNDVAYNGSTVTNTANYATGIDGGAADASFSIRYVNYVYLPVVLKDLGAP